MGDVISGRVPLGQRSRKLDAATERARPPITIDESAGNARVAPPERDASEALGVVVPGGSAAERVEIRMGVAMVSLDPGPLWAGR